MKRRTKQLLSMLLAVCMVTMMFPTGAFALEPTPEQTPAGSGIVKVADEPTATPAATPATPAGGGPRTGDNSQIMLWALLMLLSAGGVTASGIAQKKRKSHPEQ